MKNSLVGLCLVVPCALATSVSTQRAAPSFSNETSATGISVVYFANTLFKGREYCGGGAAGDFNRDGYQDMFLATGDAFTDRVYINDGAGAFVDRASTWGVTAYENSKGVAVGDYNDDGFVDVYVTSAGTATGAGPGFHHLYRNDGGAYFTDVAAQAGVQRTHPTLEDGWGAAFGDYDLDGDLDLFVGGHSSYNLGSRLFRNDRDGTFTDVTVSSGIWAGTPITMWVFAPRFLDMDGDLWPDLLLANDAGTSRYLKNDGDGTFTDVTEPAGVGLDEHGMGQTVFDYDGDGRLDWYVASAFNPPIVTGNKLYRNVGAHVYVETSASVGLDDGGHGWGMSAVDFDHDGYFDVVETNGDGSFSGIWFREQSYLWMNDGTGVFADQALSAGLAHIGRGRGLFTLDYDNDGDREVVILANAEPANFFRNELSGTDTNWLRLFLDTSLDPGLAPDGIGSIVDATFGGRTVRHHLAGGDNFLSQDELSVHFGLGAATQVDSLLVQWADGTKTILAAVAANQTLTVQAPLPPMAALLRGDTNLISLAAGGTQALSLRAGNGYANAAYLLLGSASGSAPGFGFGPHTIPLNIDPYTLLTLNSPLPVLSSSFGFLDAQGDGAAAFALPAASDPGLAGVVAVHAYAILDPLALLTVLDISNPVHVNLGP